MLAALGRHFFMLQKKKSILTYGEI
jgi:hypothetical protein